MDSTRPPAMIMAAPNGARRDRSDHPMLPVTIPQIVASARACRAAGAALLHAHVRDSEGRHVLDAGLYRELLAELSRAVPDMLVQITTDAAGRYAPEELARLVAELRPAMVSISLREMLPPGGDRALAARTYALAAEAGLHVQHILYDRPDLDRFRSEKRAGLIPAGADCLLFVLGRYSDGQKASPDELAPFLDPMPGETWFVCAFGPAEDACVRAALAAGGHARVGFENNLHFPDGSLAPDNAALVAATVLAARDNRRDIAGPATARSLLGLAPASA